jgi:hypothetical protein
MFSDDGFVNIAASPLLNKLGRLRDIVNCVAFLNSDAVAGHITSQFFSVSGDYSMAG